MNNPIENLIPLFEKLLGITLSEIDSGNYNETINSLSSIQHLLQKVITAPKNNKAQEFFQFKKVVIPERLYEKKGINFVTNETVQSFTEIVVWSLTKVWKKGFKEENADICNLSASILNEVLQYSQSSKTHYDIAVPILWSYTESTIFAIENYKEKLRKLVSKVGFSWYEDWVFHNIYELGNFDRIDTYTKLFNNFLWINFQHYVDSQNIKFYTPLIESLTDGFRFSGNYFSDVIYSSVLFKTENEEIKPLSDTINKLSNSLREINNLGKLKKWWTDYSAAHDRFSEIVLSDDSLKKIIDIDAIGNTKKNAWESAVGSFYFNKLKEIVSYTSAYALYVENYQFINELWNFNQPGDAATLNLGNRLLPETMNEIITAFVEFDDFNSIREYHIDGHHEIGYYYQQYLALLFLRQYTLLKLYITQDFLGTSSIPGSVSLNSIPNFINKLKEFKSYINLLLEEKKLLSNLKFDLEHLFENKPKPEKILDDLILKLNEQKNIVEQTAVTDPEAVKNFKKAVVDIYVKRSFYRNILVNLFQFSINLNIETANPTGIAFGVNEITTKQFLAKGNDELFFGFPERYGQEIAYQENNVIRRKLISQIENKPIKLNEILEIIQQEDLSDKVIISRNINFAYEVFRKEPEYIPKQDINEMNADAPLYDVYSGRYRGCDIYTHYDELGWKGFFIIDKKDAGIINQYSPDPESTKSDFYDEKGLFFTVDAYSEKEDLFEKTLADPPKWLLEKGERGVQEAFLKKQVRIRIAESLKIEFKNFTGKSYYIQMDANK